jgi:hypothetical protein
MAARFTKKISRYRFRHGPGGRTMASSWSRAKGKGRLTRAQQGDRGIRLAKDWMREYGSWFDSLGPAKAWRQVRSDSFPLYETLMGTRLSYVSQQLTRCEPHFL